MKFDWDVAKQKCACQSFGGIFRSFFAEERMAIGIHWFWNFSSTKKVLRVERSPMSVMARCIMIHECTLLSFVVRFCFVCALVYFSHWTIYSLQSHTKSSRVLMPNSRRIYNEKRSESLSSSSFSIKIQLVRFKWTAEKERERVTAMEEKNEIEWEIPHDDAICNWLNVIPHGYGTKSDLRCSASLTLAHLSVCESLHFYVNVHLVGSLNANRLKWRLRSTEYEQAKKCTEMPAWETVPSEKKTLVDK